MSTPYFGASFSRDNDEPIPVLGADFSQTIIFDADDTVDATLFTADEPVRVSSSDPEVQAKWGTGAIRDHLRGINAQLENLNAGADVTVYRVTPGDDSAATAAKIATALGQIGYVPDEVDATPRIVVAGMTDFRPDEEAASPVLAALAPALEQVLAVAPVDVSDDSRAASTADREFISSTRILPIGIKAVVYEGEDLVTRPMASRAAGLFIRVDNANQGKPFEPIANRQIQGLAKLSRNIRFSILDGSTEGQQMLEAQVAIAVKGKVNVDGSLASGGFTFIGADAATDDTTYQQIHQTRGADYITVKWIDITKRFLGKRITVGMAENYLVSILNMLKGHKAAEDILGYNRDIFIADQNQPDDIRLGTIKLDPRIEYAPMFKRAHADFHPYRPAVEGLIGDIVQRLSQVG